MKIKGTTFPLASGAPTPSKDASCSHRILRLDLSVFLFFLSVHASLTWIMPFFCTAVSIRGQPSKCLIHGLSVTSQACQYLRINNNLFRNHFRFRLFHFSEAFKTTNVIFKPYMQISEKNGLKRNKKAFNNEQLWKSDHPYCEAAGLLLSEQIPTEVFLNQLTLHTPVLYGQTLSHIVHCQMGIFSHSREDWRPSAAR